MAALDQALNQDRRPRKRFPSTNLAWFALRANAPASPRTHLVPAVPYCTGSGMVKSIPTICYEIQTKARKMAAISNRKPHAARHPEIAKTLKTRESSLIEELEQATRKSVIIQSDPTLHWSSTTFISPRCKTRVGTTCLKSCGHSSALPGNIELRCTT